MTCARCLLGLDKRSRCLSDCVVLCRCRRSLLADHFDEVWDNKGCNKMCDTCRHAKG